jgi:hypothetical protein
MGRCTMDDKQRRSCSTLIQQLHHCKQRKNLGCFDFVELVHVCCAPLVILAYCFFEKWSTWYVFDHSLLALFCHYQCLHTVLTHKFCFFFAAYYTFPTGATQLRARVSPVTNSGVTGAEQVEVRLRRRRRRRNRCTSHTHTHTLSLFVRHTFCKINICQPQSRRNTTQSMITM